MINKEEIEEYKQTLRNEKVLFGIQKDVCLHARVSVEKLVEYIEQLEADLYEANNTINQYKEREQKLINYLEKDITEENIRIINNSRHNGKHVKDLIELEKELIIDVLNQYRRETLERLKGEKNE